MILAVILLYVLCVAMSCIALWYRSKWQKLVSKWHSSEDMSQRRLKAYDECRKDRDRLQEELRQLRESLPKRDSKGRFCKREEGI